MPLAEDYQHIKNVKKATGAITALAVIFVLSGIVMFWLAKSHAEAPLEKLSHMSAEAIYPAAINGVSYTVGALRDRIIWESRSVLIVNLILAAVMGSLAVWGKRAPLPAVIIAAATYAVVIVTNAIISPASIAQGVYMKIVIIGFLYRGIKAALALRTANA